MDWVSGWDWVSEWVSERLIYRLNEWLSEWLIKWVINFSIDCYNWLSEWLIHWLTEWMTDWLIDWLINWLMDWFIDWLIYILIDWFIYWLAYWMIAWLIPQNFFNLYQPLLITSPNLSPGVCRGHHGHHQCYLGHDSWNQWLRHLVWTSQWQRASHSDNRWNRRGLHPKLHRTDTRPGVFLHLGMGAGIYLPHSTW